MRSDAFASTLFYFYTLHDRFFNRYCLPIVFTVELLMQMSNNGFKTGPMAPHQGYSIDSWRHSVPSRLERPDPFGNDGFGTRPSTRLVSLVTENNMVRS